MSRRKNDLLSWKQKINMLHQFFFLLSDACSSRLKTKPQASALRERQSVPKYGLEFIYGTTLLYHPCLAMRLNCPANCSVSTVGVSHPSTLPTFTPMLVTTPKVCLSCSISAITIGTTLSSIASACNGRDSC